MPTIPHSPHGFLSPTQAAHISSRGRKLQRTGQLTPHTALVLENLLWSARERGSDRVIASYSWIQKLANVCRQTVANAIEALVRLGLLRKVKHKTLALWANGGRQWRQRPNEYVFCCESARQTEYPKEVIQILNTDPGSAEIRSAQAALAERQWVIQTRLRGKGNGSPIRAA